MLKWFKPKCKQECDPSLVSMDVIARLSKAEHSIENLKDQMELLERSFITFSTKDMYQSKITLNPAPKKVGRPRKK